MKRKDLHIGDEVAVKVGYGVYRAWVLDFDWVETKAYRREDIYSKARDSDLSGYGIKPGIAIARHWSGDDCRADVVYLNAILSSWADYEVAQAKQRDKAKVQWAADQAANEARKDRWSALRSRLATHGINLPWPDYNGTELTLSLDEVERLLSAKP